MRELEVFQRIEKTPGKNDKIKILRENETLHLRTLLWLTYNKFITYRVKAVEQPSTYNQVQPDITAQLYELLMELAKHQTGTNQAKVMIKRLLSLCTREGAQWVTKVIDRDLKIGIDVSTINKAFPDLIPVFDIQLANKVESLDDVKFPVALEEKLDGMRMVALVENDKVTLYSREGLELDDRGVFAEQILKLRPGTDFVLDGEIIAKKFNPNNKTAVKNKEGNWPFAQALSMVKTEATTKAEYKEYLGYFVWDVLDLDYFKSRGKQGVKKILTERKCELLSLFERTEQKFENLFMVPNILCHTKADVLAAFRKIRDKKGEGVMLKNLESLYEFKRSNAVQKLKEFYTADMRVVGAYEGEKGAKYEGMLGGVEVALDDGKVKSDIGSGYTDLERAEFWLRYLNGTLLGAIFEVSYMEVTADDSLRHGTFVRERTDKTTTHME